MVIIIIILALLAGIYFVHGIFYNNGNTNSQEPADTEQVQPLQESTTVEQPVAEPTPVEEPAEESEESVEEDTLTDNENEESTEAETGESGNEVTPPDDTAENPDGDVQ